MRLAPESRPFLLVAMALTAVAWALGGWPWAVAPGLALLFTLYFFRDPRREVPAGEGLVLAPADGRVVDLRQVEEPGFPGGRAWRLSIFLSIFDVHVNRAPARGTVTGVTYSRGRFRAAFHGKASEENERNRIDLDTAGGPLAVTQIAGAVARRIVCDVRPGQQLQAGERFGMIRFGSRVDLFLPLDATPAVGRGERVRAAASILARRPLATANQERGRAGAL